ncbi:MAG: PrsW family intramembrane metalloprotease [Bacteroidales bacterium]|nr:PrsW family intramembrane metalloprotease [Bacteroidales bacterium]
MNFLFIALAPILIIAFYLYYRDKYEKEPLGLLIKALVAGGLITIPVIFTERFLLTYIDNYEGLSKAAYHAFVVAAFTEELFKYLALWILIWRNPNFNEKFDGIVYAVFISLGFAAVENVMYVTSYGIQVGWIRAFTAVPAHALFGITMGYFYGLARFYPEGRVTYLSKSIIYAIFLHGVYDFILMSQHQVLLLLFIPFIVYLWITGFKKMKSLSDRSRFRPLQKGS